jgi:hypothetical protein
MFQFSGADCHVAKDSILAISADFAIVGIFFAMQSCEIDTNPGTDKNNSIFEG